MCRKNIARCERAFVLIGLFLAVIEISLELSIFEVSIKYEPENVCCGLVLATDEYGDLESNKDLVLSPPCDILTIGENGMEINDGNNYCIVNGVVCDKYGNDGGTLSSCLSDGGYAVDTLCSKESMLQLIREFRGGLWLWLIVILLGMGYTIALDLGDLFKDTKCCEKLKSMHLKPHCECFKKKMSNVCAFWCFQFFVWLCAIIYGAMTANAMELGYQNIDISTDSSNSTMSATNAAEYVEDHCNSDSSPIVASFDDLGESTATMRELSNVVAPFGLILTVVGLIFEAYHFTCDKDDDEVGGEKQQVEMQIQQGVPTQTTGYAMPPQQNVVYMPQQQNVVYYPAQQYTQQPVVQYVPQQNVVYVQPTNGQYIN